MAKRKISKVKIAQARSLLSGGNHGGSNESALVNPIKTLFGSWEHSADLPDFFKDTSKKTLGQYAITLDQLLKLVQMSWNPKTLELEVHKWQELMQQLEPGVDGQIEGSAFSCKELEQLAFGTRQHYALVSVASGFDWSARGLNLLGLLQGTGWFKKLPVEIQAHWQSAVLVCIWCIYEGLGLSGYNQQVLDWHAAMRKYCRSGNLNHFTVGETLTVHRAKHSQDEQFLHAVFQDLLRGEGIRDEVITSQEVWQIILFLAHGREIQARLSQGRKLGKYLSAYGQWDFDPEAIQFLVLAAQLQRAASKGRLSLDEGDDVEGNAGLVQALGKTKYDPYWEFVKRVKYPTASIKMLIDVYPILQKWSGTRSTLLQQESEF